MAAGLENVVMAEFEKALGRDEARRARRSPERCAHDAIRSDGPGKLPMRTTNAHVNAWRITTHDFWATTKSELSVPKPSVRAPASSNTRGFASNPLASSCARCASMVT